jgi:hypothetical protein
MYAIPPTLGASDYSTVTSSSQQFSLPLVKGVQYVLQAETDLFWRADSSNPTAAAADNSHFLARGAVAYIAGSGFKVAVIRKDADGIATLSVLQAMG